MSSFFIKSAKYFICGLLIMPLYSRATDLSSKNIKIPCETQVLNTLSNLELAKEWTEVPMATTGKKKSSLRIFKSLTVKKDVALELNVTDKNARIERKSPESIIEYNFSTDSKCIPNLLTKILNKPGPELNEQFTDMDLQKAVEQSRTQKRNLLIYTWSPRMNLSITGVQEIRKIAKKRAMDLIVLADPLAEKENLRKIADEKQWPTDYLRRLESTQLKSMNALVHFPSLIIYEKGKVAGPVRPGYDEPARLEKFLGQIPR